MSVDDLRRPLGAHVAGHNVGSRRVLEKCGFVQIGAELLTLRGGETVEMLSTSSAEVGEEMLAGTKPPTGCLRSKNRVSGFAPLA